MLKDLYHRCVSGPERYCGFLICRECRNGDEQAEEVANELTTDGRQGYAVVWVFMIIHNNI